MQTSSDAAASRNLAVSSSANNVLSSDVLSHSGSGDAPSRGSGAVSPTTFSSESSSQQYQQPQLRSTPPSAPTSASVHSSSSPSLLQSGEASARVPTAKVAGEFPAEAPSATPTFANAAAAAAAGGAPTATNIGTSSNAGSGHAASATVYSTNAAGNNVIQLASPPSASSASSDWAAASGSFTTSASGSSVASVSSVSSAASRLSKQERDRIKKEIKKDEEFHSLFKVVPETEGLIDDISCALQREILIQGRLYFSQNWLCFYANILSWETSLVLQFDDITDITKERTALIIPNAIQVSTPTSKHTFSSILSRDQVYSKLVSVWKSHGREASGSTANGDDGTSRHSEDKLKASDADEPSRPSTSTGRTSTDSNDSGPQSPASVASPPAAVTSDVPHIPHSASAPVFFPGSAGTLPIPTPHPSIASLDPPSVPSPASTSTATAAAVQPEPVPLPAYPEKEVVCGCSSSEHYQTEFLNQVYDTDVDTLYNLIFTECDSYLEFLKTRKSSEIHMTPWHVENDETVREVKYILELNKSMGPKSTQCIENQRTFAHQSLAKAIVETNTTTPYVPYGDSFGASSRYCITHISPGKCRLAVTAQVKYFKSVFGLVKRFIESNTIEGLHDHYKALDVYLKTTIAKTPRPEPAAGAARPSATLPAEVPEVKPTVVLPPTPAATPAPAAPIPAPQISTSGGFFSWLTANVGRNLTPATIILLVFCLVLLIANVVLFARVVRIDSKLYEWNRRTELNFAELAR
ncbi:hypothetical protein, variant [Capsaspora owczarzaki ATCC 30864]|uniref:VASt domain-containing protein n=1 Tax=Capsaspora owczarzaki (strain ATCC 30864) TaxID=595528 RepID=A0A0D2U9A6_CAPO3|nr:hypothetical protein, variant [Capsaspora owczarzaki ATCC 30864]